MTPQITAGMVAAENVNAELIQGLRELASFLEAHPELRTVNASTFDVFLHGPESKAEMAHFAKIAGGRVEKDSTSSLFWFRKTFSGNVRLDLNAPREEVCERVQVGTTVEPEHVIPAQEEQVVPAKEVPVYEWRCGSILAPAIEEAELEVAP